MTVRFDDDRRLGVLLATMMAKIMKVKAYKMVQASSDSVNYHVIAMKHHVCITGLAFVSVSPDSGVRMSQLTATYSPAKTVMMMLLMVVFG